MPLTSRFSIVKRYITCKQPKVYAYLRKSMIQTHGVAMLPPLKFCAKTVRNWCD